MIGPTARHVFLRDQLESLLVQLVPDLHELRPILRPNAFLTGDATERLRVGWLDEDPVEFGERDRGDIVERTDGESARMRNAGLRQELAESRLVLQYLQ